jgi:phage terminase large subunit GpA-like protein
MSSAQVGKTEILNNLIGYHIHQDAAPILLLQPTLEMAQAWSKDRLAPMLRDTPALRGRVKQPRSKNSANTLLHKVFPGGHITMAGSNSPASLASRPVRIVLCDEVDRYPVSAGTEGDPVNLARKRTATFWSVTGRDGVRAIGPAVFLCTLPALQNIPETDLVQRHLVKG